MQEKKKLFLQSKQGVLMSTNDFVEMTISLRLICFTFMQKFNLPAKMVAKNVRKTIFGKNCQLTVDTLDIIIFG